MKILITGGLGLIGSRLTRQLLDAGHEVFIYDAQLHFAKTGYHLGKLREDFLGDDIDIVMGDIRDNLYFSEALSRFNPEVVVHLAAVPVFNPRMPFFKEIFDINLIGSRVVFEESAKALSVKRVVFASSSMAYGHFLQDPQPENAILNPIDRYGVTKAASELLLKQTLGEVNKQWIIIRPTSVYGETDCNNRVIQRFVQAAVNGEESITATEGESLDFTYVEDIAQGFRLACETTNVNEIYNVSAGQARKVTDAAQIVRLRFPELKINLQGKAADGYRPVRGTLDIIKAKEKLGYQPQYTLERGMNKYIDWALEHK